MESGRIQQVGSPQEVYKHPANLFTSGFMGDNNVFAGRVTGSHNGEVAIAGDGLRFLARHDGAGISDGQQLHAAIRASCVSVEPVAGDGTAAGSEPPNHVEATLTFIEYLGDIVKLHCRLPNGQTMVAKRPEQDRVWYGLAEGEPVRLRWEAEDVQLLLA
jgi:ABC-type Fe3+/spermidine/putrescine transport system ATPase subunit